MAGHVPAIPLERLPQVSSRLVDRHPSIEPQSVNVHTWGETRVLSHSGGHRVERISVKAGKSMPLHYHNHRSEHWTVLEGEGEVTLGDDVLIVSPDDSLYVPAGAVHGVKAGAGGTLVFVAVHFGDTVDDAEDFIALG